MISTQREILKAYRKIIDAHCAQCKKPSSYCEATNSSIPYDFKCKIKQINAILNGSLHCSSADPVKKIQFTIKIRCLICIDSEHEYEESYACHPNIAGYCVYDELKKAAKNLGCT